MPLKTPQCEYRKPHVRNLGLCGLGYYGGKVTMGTCNRCIQRGENNEAFAADLAARAAKAHPKGAKRVSGCCDSALNYR